VLWGRLREALPDSVAGVQVKAAKLAVTVYVENVLALKDGSGYAAVQAVCFFSFGPLRRHAVGDVNPSTGDSWPTIAVGDFGA